MKVHWWTYNHCLFVAYFTSVALGYGWISDTKFQKFSDKDWIWIKNLSDTDQELKNQIFCRGQKFRLTPDSESKICEKPYPESLFDFGRSRSLCRHFLSNSWVNYGWIDDCIQIVNKRRILKFEKLPDPESKFWNRSGV